MKLLQMTSQASIDLTRRQISSNQTFLSNYAAAVNLKRFTTFKVFYILSSAMPATSEVFVCCLLYADKFNNY